MEINEPEHVREAIKDIKDIVYDYTSVNFLSRFACLHEAVNIACDKAEQLGINPDKSSVWIKPLAFHKYIVAREKDMRYQVKAWKKLGKDVTHAKSSFFEN
jgi:hypothetical protein